MEIEDVRRLVVHPGETLVVRFPRGASMEQARFVEAGIRRHLPEGVNILFVSNDIELEVVADAVARTS